MRKTYKSACLAELPHYGQILTNRETIVDYMWAVDHDVTINALYLLAAGIESPENRLRLYAVCARLYYLSRLVYAKGDEIAATAYTKDDGQEMTMVMYFSPEFSKEMMSGDDIDMSEFSDFLS